MVFLVGALHLVLGVRAEVLLGANLPPETLRDATLDSQNRFYGVAFTLNGVLMMLCATDLPRYRGVLLCLLGVLFAAGLARLVSVATHGLPAAPVLALLASELLLVPLLALWAARIPASCAGVD